MKQRSPTIEGFRAMFRQPSFGLAEIAWRWSFGASALVLLGFAFLEYLKTLPVTVRDLLLLRSGQPAFISQALGHIFRGSAGRAADALLVVGLAMIVAWMTLAALGRSITTKSLLSYFYELGMVPSRELGRGGAGSLLGLNFFRVAAALAAAVGVIAAWTFGGAVSPASDPSPGSAFLVFLTVLMLVGLAWSGLNWFLSLAAVFAVADGEHAFGAIGAAADLCRDRTGALVAASFWFGLAHIVAFVVASSVIAFPLGFAAVLPGGMVFGGVLLIALLYFAVADFLYVGRLAAYVAIAESSQIPFLAESSAPASGAAFLATPEPGSIDPDELILSDLPGR